MNEKELSCLSYKELQALAVKYRVPGNIKKDLLVQVLQAVKTGNETEVAKILGELHQARKKKRLKKIKRDKMSVISTPMHSPSYAMSDDCYYAQQPPPYQWVGAVEEIGSREEESSTRVPDYEEFERFLLRRIQRDYQSYALSDGVQGHQVPSIVDLRMGAGSSTLEPMMLDGNRGRSSIIIDANNYARGCASEGDLQTTSEDANGNNVQSGPVLLKRMLEAPAGANLGAIASPEKDSYRMWSSEKLPNNCVVGGGGDNVLDDSETMTADSEIDNEDDAWETSNNVNNSAGYFCIMNSNKLSSNQPEAQEAQLANSFLTDGTNHYQVLYPAADVQTNCQKWIASNSFAANRDSAGYAISSNAPENSRGFHPIYYEETSGNSTITRPINLERKSQQFSSGQNQNLIYEANQTILQGQIANEANQYYQNNGGVAAATVNNNSMDVYYSHQIAKRIGEATQDYFAQGNYGNPENTQNAAYQPPTAHQNAAAALFNANLYNKDNANCAQSAENNPGAQYAAGYYQQYSQDNSQSVTGFSYPENTNQQEINHGHQQHRLEHHTQANVAQEIDPLKNNATPQTMQTASNGALDPFWPRWPLNGAMTSDGQLESIVNLHHCNYVDYSKIDQTSCVYCYTAPVVTQRICGSSSSFCTQKRRLVAECRQYVFSANRLVYNDASTGMRMANLSVEGSPMEATSAPELLSSSTDPESETTVVGTTVSSDSSMNDVWIHDYSKYPISSENGPHSVGLIIDENEDDLFSL